MDLNSPAFENTAAAYIPQLEVKCPRCGVPVGFCRNWKEPIRCLYCNQMLLQSGEKILREQLNPRELETFEQLLRSLNKMNDKGNIGDAMTYFQNPQHVLELVRQPNPARAIFKFGEEIRAMYTPKPPPKPHFQLAPKKVKKWWQFWK